LEEKEEVTVMKRQLAIKGLFALVVSAAAVLCFVLQPFDSVHAGPPTPTPTPEVMTLLHLDLDDLSDETAGELSVVSMSVSPAGINATAVITAFADTEIIQGYLTANCADSLFMRAGYDTYLNPDGRIVRSLIRFNVAGIPSGATIHSASLRLYLSNSYDYPGHSVPIRPYRISSPWAVDTVTWDSAPLYAESYPATWIGHGPVGWYSFNVTDLVRVWTDGTYPNYGIMLRGPETSVGWREFTTSETIYPPQLVVEYEYEPGFDLTIVPDSLSVSPGNSTSSVVYLTARSGFADSVTLDVGGLPISATHEWGTNSVMPTNSTVLTITTTADTPGGVHALTITGTGGGIVQSTQATLEVRAPGPPATTTIYLPVVLKNYLPSVTTSSVSRVALVIGISDYEHMDPVTGTRAGAPGNDTLYSTYDLYDSEDIFLTAGAFDSANSISLSDVQATKAAIHAAIVNRLDPLEDENTVVVIPFSGHGMYAPDDDGDENDAYDEFIVPHEIEWDPIEGWRYEMAISDDELQSWLSVLESQHIVILIDSCFSGGMIEITGTQTIGTKGLSWQPAAQGKVTAAQWRDGFTRDIQGSGRVVLTASAEDQPSWESGELKNGVFTYYLLEALRSPSADANSNGWISAEEAYDYLDDRVDDYVWENVNPPHTYNQNPQVSDGVSGEVDLTQLGGAIDPCPSWY
jgi:hypothetical protein